MNQQDEIRYLEHRLNQLKMEGQQPQKKSSEFKLWVFILLLILFWPAALVYVVYWGFKK